MEDGGGAGQREDGPRREGHRPLDITVLMGGPSAEREVSVMSGTAVADALERRGHRVTRADICPEDTSALDRQGADLVFITLHGQFGESGEVQQLCEDRGLRYTGSGPKASQLAMDKAAAKQILKRAGLHTPDWMIIEGFHTHDQFEGWLKEIPPPVVIKPVDGGSSIDITIARDAAARDAAIEAVIDKYGRTMLERFVKGRELTVGILAERPLPLMEIIPAREFYDYAAKYADDAGTEYIFEHGLDAAIVREAQQAALLAHSSLGCRDLSRVDFILDGAGRLQVLEVNTIPGFTGHSLVPMAAARAGIDFEELVDRLARMAMNRQDLAADPT